MLLLGFLEVVQLHLGLGRASTFPFVRIVRILGRACLLLLLLLYNHRRQLLHPFLNTVVYPASASFGMLISAECSPGTMFISLAASHRLCLSSILFVAFPVRPSGNIQVFSDECPVSSSSSLTSSGAAPEVAPESRKATCLSLLMLNFLAQCDSCLLGGIPLPIADRAVSM